MNLLLRLKFLREENHSATVALMQRLFTIFIELIRLAVPDGDPLRFFVRPIEAKINESL